MTPVTGCWSRWAGALARISRRGDTVARFGGDEFVLLRANLNDDDDARLIASRALRAIGERFVHAGQRPHRHRQHRRGRDRRPLGRPRRAAPPGRHRPVRGQGRRARLLPGL